MKVVVNKDYKELFVVGGGLVLLAAVEIISTFVQARCMGKMGLNIITRIRTDIFEKLQQLSFEYFDNRPDGKIVVRVTEYINGLADFFSNYVMMFAIYIVKIVVVTVFMLSLSPMLTLVVFATIIPMITVVFMLRSFLRKKYTVHRAKNSNRTAFLVESIMGEQIVKNYNRIDINKNVYKQIHEESVNMWWTIVLRSRLNHLVVMVFWHIGTLCIYGIALMLILSGNSLITAGIVVTFTTYMSSFQDPFIFKGTVMDNIRYGKWDATDDECIEAAKKIFADKSIQKLNGGYNHVLEERGSGLSAGEKQLISFARIILKNPSVIILDEATSAIDTETEMLIKNALDIIIKDKTAFIVAHRLSTIRNADRILYISNKGIAEEGTHDELMARKGLYYELAR